MVQRQLRAARLGTAVLAGVVVTLEDVAAAEGDWPWDAVVVAQGDNLRHPQPEPTARMNGSSAHGFSFDQSAQV